MKYFITFLLCFASIFSNAQQSIKPESFIMTFECGSISPDSAINFYKSLNLNDFLFSKNNSTVTIEAECKFDSVILSKLYTKGVLFELYPLIKLPEPSPIFESYEIDEEAANNILSSEYILQLEIPFICSKWEKEEMLKNDFKYRYYLYNCSAQTIIENNDITSITIGKSKEKSSIIQIGYTPLGQQKIYEYSKNNITNSIAFLISKSVFSAPTIIESINSPFTWITDDANIKNNIFLWQLIAYPILHNTTITSIRLK